MLKIRTRLVDIAIAIVFFIFFQSCGKPFGGMNDRREQNDSSFSTISLDLPEIDKIKVDKAEAREKLNSYRLVIEPLSEQCGNAETTDVIRELKSPHLAQKIKKGCDYSVGLQLGNVNLAEINDRHQLDEVYFTNWTGPKTGKKLPATQENKAEIQISLSITQQGRDVGFAGSIDASGHVDDNTDREFTVYKGETKEGVKEPVYWYHKSHGLEVRSHYDTGKVLQYNYADLWLASVLTVAFRELNKKFNVVGLHHMGIYNYRNIAGTNSLSRHAYALAIDLSTFILKDGSQLSVEKDWKDPSKGATLRAMAEHFKGHMAVVLTPDYDESHSDHFHIDLNPDKRPDEYPLFGSRKWQDLPDQPLTLVNLLRWNGDDEFRRAAPLEGDEGLKDW